jgi:hypothetical protein
MHSRFIKKRDIFLNEWLASDDRSLKIETYDTINITLQTSNDLKLMTLLNVAYVSNFMTNAVSQNLLYVKDLYFDNDKLHLHKKENIIAWVKRFNDHYLLKNNTAETVACFISSTITALSTQMIKKITEFEWH